MVGDPGWWVTHTYPIQGGARGGAFKSWLTARRRVSVCIHNTTPQMWSRGLRGAQGSSRRQVERVLWFLLWHIYAGGRQQILFIDL
jgi:hypothetical protein